MRVSENERGREGGKEGERGRGQESLQGKERVRGTRNKERGKDFELEMQDIREIKRDFKLDTQ
jgi:hypothetical protein